MKLKNLILGIFTYLNYNYHELLPVYLTKSFSFLFVQTLITLFYLGWSNDREIEYRRVCWQNYALYLRNIFLEERLKDLRNVMDNVEDEMMDKMSKYQRSIGVCPFPYCKESSKSLCEYHSKYKRDDCVICFEKFEKDYYPLSCGHWIHQECLKKSGSRNCSLCRKENKYF